MAGRESVFAAQYRTEPETMAIVTIAQTAAITHVQIHTTITTMHTHPHTITDLTITGDTDAV